MAKFNPDDCKFCNNTDGNKADAHVFMLNGLLVAKDVVMPKAGV